MLAKTIDFTKELQETARFAKALSHPARLAILQHLAQQKSCFSGNIADELPLSRSTVSQHLQELQRAGLIKGTIEGVRINYCIDIEVYERCSTVLGGFFTELSGLPGFEC
jgi:DNA-binding transcriptional ArsR family regulator